MGKPSREKGARGERDFRDLLRRYGFYARRDGRLDDDLQHDVDGVHFEVKRCERLEIPKWLEQAKRDAGARVPAVAFRRNHDIWRVVVPAEHYLELLNRPKGEEA